MSVIGIGCRFWKTADREHIWVVDAVVPPKDGKPGYALLVSEDGLKAEDVDLSHLADPEQFTSISQRHLP